jgi:hypothetical protein
MHVVWMGGPWWDCDLCLVQIWQTPSWVPQGTNILFLVALVGLFIVFKLNGHKERHPQNSGGRFGIFKGKGDRDNRSGCHCELCFHYKIRLISVGCISAYCFRI